MPQIKDLHNQKFGKLIVSNQYRNVIGKSGKKYIHWLCKCDCGREKYILSSSLLHKTKPTKSCGCIRKSGYNYRLTDTEFNTNQIYNRYRIGAKKRNLEFLLNKEQFTEFINRNCFYCNSQPRIVNAYDSNRKLVYNGIDRIDNSKGYILSNCVSCCFNCNSSKRDLTLNDFLEWITKVFEFQKEKGNI